MTTHGATRGRKPTKEYKAWENMRARCLNKHGCDYAFYGGRGITVCPEWMNSFEQFFADMGPRPSGYTLDRIDVNGNYSKENCRWATWKTQALNRRRPARYTNRHKGVYFNPWNKKKKWTATIYISSWEHFSLGTFVSEEDAYNAVKAYRLVNSLPGQ